MHRRPWTRHVLVFNIFADVAFSRVLVDYCTRVLFGCFFLSPWARGGSLLKRAESLASSHYSPHTRRRTDCFLSLFCFLFCLGRTCRDWISEHKGLRENESSLHFRACIQPGHLYLVDKPSSQKFQFHMLWCFVQEYVTFTYISVNVFDLRVPMFQIGGATCKL
ncbi:hypothetical protein LY76DRAFT_298049 [Colletotrichum caudatum]|nr:hypothetical protein LY76DRAFT_298049 [Colletotrichum caudatum]